MNRHRKISHNERKFQLRKNLEQHHPQVSAVKPAGSCSNDLLISSAQFAVDWQMDCTGNTEYRSVVQNEYENRRLKVKITGYSSTSSQTDIYISDWF